MDPITLLRVTKKTLPVLVLLRLLDRPLNSSQVASYLDMDEKTARRYLVSLSRLNPPMVAIIGNGAFISLPSAQLIFDNPVDNPVDNSAESVDNHSKDDGKISRLSKLSKKESNNNNIIPFLTDSSSKHNTADSEELLSRLQALGVYRVTALDLIARHPPEKILAAIAIYIERRRDGTAKSPGYLVLSLRESWVDPNPESSDAPSKFTSGKYSDFVIH